MELRLSGIVIFSLLSVIITTIIVISIILYVSVLQKSNEYFRNN